LHKGYKLKLSCPWHVNLSFPEHETKIIVTTFINQHNHALSPKTQEFATKYRSFTDEALHEISLITKHENLSLTVQRSLLKARFPDLHFQDQDLANAIQKYKKSDKINNDASALLTSLMQKKVEDLR
ncbi:11324_t:CDS:1, partial [Cetraspora pellucida]